ncbi:MAG: STAS domain-containing protein [Fibrobacteria bacterium]
MPIMDMLLGDLNYTLGVGQTNTFLRVAGNLAGGNAAKLSVIFNRTLAHAKGKLFLSLQGCYTIDSTALAAMVCQHKALGILAREMVLVDVPSQILQVLEGSHLASLFEIFPSLEDAEKKYGRSIC